MQKPDRAVTDLRMDGAWWRWKVASDLSEMGKEKRMRKWDLYEITKMLDTMIGGTEPVADSTIDSIVKDNVEVMTSVIDWCLDGMQRTASYRKSDYASQREIGEYAYSVILNWKEWLADVEKEYA